MGKKLTYTNLNTFFDISKHFFQLKILLKTLNATENTTKLKTIENNTSIIVLDTSLNENIVILLR